MIINISLIMQTVPAEELVKNLEPADDFQISIKNVRKVLHTLNFEAQNEFYQQLILQNNFTNPLYLQTIS